MDRLRAIVQRRLNNLFTQQIAFRRPRAANVDGDIAELDVLRIRIGVGVNRNRTHAQLAAGTHNSAGDFATVGDQDRMKHGVFARKIRRVLSLADLYGVGKYRRRITPATD